MTIESEFLRVAAERLQMLCGRIETCVAKLTPEQVWMRHSENENAVGNLLLHLTGNVRQWIICGLGGAPDTRERHREFAAREPLPPAELVARLRATVEQASRVIQALPPAEFLERIKIQSYDVTKMEAVQDVLDHFAGHTFQIIFATKLLTSQDLGFYAHLNPPAAKNESA